LNNIRSIGHLLGKQEKKRFLILVLQMIMAALLEFTGIALVLPFIKLAGNQLPLESMPRFLSSLSIFNQKQDMLIVIGFTIFLLIVLSTISKIYLSWREQRFIWEISHKLAIQQHKNILAKPYAFFIEKNSAEIITTLIVETSTAVRGILLPSAQIISNSFIAILFLALITFLHPKISLIFIFFSALIGLIIILMVKEKLKILGQNRIRLERSRFVQLKESIVGIKTVKSSQKESFFLNKFEDVSSDYSKIKPLVNTLNTVPKNIFDIVLFGGVILAATLLLINGTNITSFLPSLTFYVFVGFKLLPTFQNIINSIITIRFSWPSLRAVFDGLQKTDDHTIIQTKNNTLSFKDKIVLSNCYFEYQPDNYILKDINIEIKKGQKVGIVGFSGSGKTTLVEILSGLLAQTKGHIFVDDVEIDKNNRFELMRLISFVPQDVFFFDDSILKNITLEEDDSHIDNDRLSTILEILDLNDFMNQLQQGLHTHVGEFGIKLSGGQKQRIGFARALYKKPEILILDESTSALDYITEKELLANLKIHFPELTILKVAHRLKSVIDCENIFFLDQGEVMASGTFKYIAENNSLFKEMVSAGTFSN